MTDLLPPYPVNIPSTSHPLDWDALPASNRLYQWVVFLKKPDSNLNLFNLEQIV